MSNPHWEADVVEENAYAELQSEQLMSKEEHADMVDRLQTQESGYKDLPW